MLNDEDVVVVTVLTLVGKRECPRNIIDQFVGVKYLLPRL